MPTTIRVFRENRLHPVNYSAESLADAVRHEPDGVYTVTNTCHTTQVLKFDAHLNRMEDSAMRADIPLKIDRGRLRSALRQMIEDKCRHPINSGNQKIIVFTAFSDTAHYLYAQLAPWAKSTLGIDAALVTGSATVTPDWYPPHHRAQQRPQ